MTIQQMVYMHNAHATGLLLPTSEKITRILFRRIHEAKKTLERNTLNKGI